MSEPIPSFDPQPFLKTLTHRPGVYRMLGEGGEILYVGKAKDLKKRVSSYFRKSGLTIKTHALVSHVRDMAITVTNTETEALILEQSLIKEHRPRYNVLLRDDKSYPYIYLSDGEYPRLTVHRGARRGKGRYFGPFPSALAVRDSLNLLQKLFRVRQCEDSFFRNRSRPCLQYQIKRCTAPCVRKITPQGYADDVRHTVLFLEGKNNRVIDELVKRMEAASQRLEFEEAAEYRDQIVSLRRVQERQYVEGEGGDLDIVAVTAGGGVGCVQLFFVRAGRNLGNKAFFPKMPEGSDTAEVLSAFLSQYYLGHPPPAEILVNVALDERELLEHALGEQARRKVAITHRLRGDRARWLKMAVSNAENALQAHLASRAGINRRYQLLQQILGLDEPIVRMECFDISHTMGESTVASCVVFNGEGPLKSDYRRFNINDITPGDDYAAMRQALTRRYTKIKAGEGRVPDILFIDGGKGQMGVAEEVLEELQMLDIALVGVAKGEARRPGEETLFLSGSLSGRRSPLILPADSPALHLIQQIRDEAHRFAITGHRQRRAKTRRSSPLEGIPGMGPKRRQQLLRQFGGLQEIARAGVEDLAKAPGISRALAQKVYDAFHEDPDH
ncbi:excinuclease ABC subunit UvrC [Endothiovibrio diazotrophicus]